MSTQLKIDDESLAAHAAHERFLVSVPPHMTAIVIKPWVMLFDMATIHKVWGKIGTSFTYQVHVGTCMCFRKSRISSVAWAL